MPKCLLCHQDKASLTDEHIIPAALGSDLILSKSTCEDCQRRCNKSFEGRFLKGSNFVSLIRSLLGIRGRRDEPIYGFDKHGNPLTVVVQPGFPPIRVGLAHGRLERPMQVILTDDTLNAGAYYFLPDTLERPVTKSLFERLVSDMPSNATHAAFWADGDYLAVNHWHDIIEAFVSWCDSRKLTALTSKASSSNVRINLVIDWNAEYIRRSLTKICYMYTMSRLSYSDRFSPLFEHARRYILEGKPYPADYWKHAPVLQWDGPKPAQDVMKSRKLTYFLACLNIGNSIFSLIWLTKMGLFAVKVCNLSNRKVCEDRITVYLLEKKGNNNYIMKEDDLDVEDIEKFKISVKSSGQL